jgi:hypothetical protein
MNDRLETLLRDPRAHQDAPDADAVRDWGEQALARWQTERAAEARLAPRRRFGWVDLATAVGVLSAVVALAPVIGALGGRAWTAWQAGGSRWVQALTEVSPELMAAAALAVFLSVPQLRGVAGRLLDG